MEKTELAFKPEWLKSSNASAANNASANHHSTISSHSGMISVSRTRMLIFLSVASLILILVVYSLK